MTILYNCKSAGHPGAYIITKFDDNMNVESSYLVSNGECACPRGSHPTCRHRKMLRDFTKHKHVDDGWFLDFDTRIWHEVGDVNADADGLENDGDISDDAAVAPTPDAEAAPSSGPVLPPAEPAPASGGLKRRMIRS